MNKAEQKPFVKTVLFIIKISFKSLFYSLSFPVIELSRRRKRARRLRARNREVIDSAMDPSSSFELMRTTTPGQLVSDVTAIVLNKRVLSCSMYDLRKGTQILLYRWRWEL